MKIALVYEKPGVGIAKNFDSKEFDDEPTINQIERSLIELGHEVEKIVIDFDIVEKLRYCNPDLVFNRSAGAFGESREAHLPAILEMLGIPYTGCGPLSCAICQDKVKTKEILAYHGIPTPKYQVFYSGKEKMKPSLSFPLIVKPASEGSSIGISENSVVFDEDMLNEQIKRILKNLRQPSLVEEFIDGTEIAASIMGNRYPKVLPILECIFLDVNTSNRFWHQELKFSDRLQTQWVKDVCPAKISKKLENKIIKTSVEAFRILDCRDYVRLDYRLGKDGKLYFIEINPNPSLDVSGSGFLISSKAFGFSYTDMIKGIIDAALEKYQKNEAR